MDNEYIENVNSAIPKNPNSLPPKGNAAKKPVAPMDIASGVRINEPHAPHPIPNIPSTDPPNIPKTFFFLSAITVALFFCATKTSMAKFIANKIEIAITIKTDKAELLVPAPPIREKRMVAFFTADAEEIKTEPKKEKLGKIINII
ncbi:MAG: hypothetical protein Q8P37_00630 [Candidatus Spechtbacteria bacterium]|nr:hypothetical protein [Candidatus Spechtbacteria bacterium]